MLVAGLLTPLATSILSSVMVTAIRKVHWQNGLWAGNGGYEFNATLLAALFLLADQGPGPWSLDAALGSEHSGAGWGLAELAAGTLASTLVIAAANRQPASEAGQAPQEDDIQATATTA